MAIHIRDSDKPGPDSEKPRALWQSDDGWSLECPFCGREEPSEDRLGFHFVRDHWREIDYIAREAPEVNQQ